MMNRHTPEEVEFILDHPGSYNPATVREAERQKAAQQDDARQLGIKEARANLSRLVKDAAAGAPIRITIGGQAMAILTQDPEAVAYSGDDDG